MSASNSISQLLEQFLELNTNSLETVKRINEAITTDKETVTIDLFNSKTNLMETIQIPAFGYLKRELDRLNNNIVSISGLEGSNANVRLKDGTYRTVHTSRLKGPSPSITTLVSPTIFTTKLNDFFEEFLNPLLTINLDVSGQIPVETEKVYVERFIFNENDAASINSFDEIYKGGSEISYSELMTDINDNNWLYYLDSQVVDMPIRKIKYNGFFDVIKIDNVQKNIIIDGINQVKGVKLFTLNKLSYTDSTKILKDTESLKLGDSLIVNSGNYRTRYQVLSIDGSTTQIELLLLEGSESIKIGVEQLGIYKEVESNLNVEINVAFNERQIVFIKPIDPNSKIPAENYSPGVGFYSNDLEITDVSGNKVKLAEYYKNEVADFGQFIKSLKVDYIPPSAVGIKPSAPLIDIVNFKVVQINSHLTDNSTTEKIKQLKSDKFTTEQSLNKIDESIKQKKSLINTKKFTSSAEKDSHNNELISLVLQRESESKLFTSTVNEIKAAGDSSNIQLVSPKYRVRGFWSVPNPKSIGNQVSQEVIQFKIRYRYVSTSGKTSTIDQIKFIDSVTGTEKTAVFSNWTELLGPIRKREKNSYGKFNWIMESEENASAVNFNSFEISINPGEIVEFMIKSISEAGFPSNPLESEWSSIQKIEFPQGQFNTDSLGNVIKVNELDLLKVQIIQDLESAGIYKHVGESFDVGNQTFAHNANKIASGFLTDILSPVSVYEKLLSLQNEILSLRAIIEGTTGELLVRIIDENGNITPVTNNTTVQLFAGYYIQEIPTTGGKGYIVTKNFKLELSNTKATDLELIARIIGDTTQPAHVSTNNTIFGLGTGTANNAYDGYYSEEARYDMVPVIYQNIKGLDESYFNSGPEQSTQVKGQFIYSRFKNIANDDNLYIFDESGLLSSNANGDIDPSVPSTPSYDKYEYGLSYPIFGVTEIVGSGSKSFSAATQNIFTDANSGENDFIWSGGYTGVNGTKTTTTIGVDIDFQSYSNGMYIHIDHPIITGYSSNADNALLKIASNGLVGMPKTAVRRSTDAHGKKQTPLRILNTVNSDNIIGLRQTIKNGFAPEDQYLLGGHSCGSFLYISPLNVDSLIVDASNKNGKKIIPGGSANSISLDIVFQYRMTDYYGAGSSGTGLVGGILNNILTNLSYAKKIGIDILDFGKNDFKFDIEVHAKYTSQGKNINNITGAMLSNYNSNFLGSRGRRRYLSAGNIDFSFPEIGHF